MQNWNITTDRAQRVDEKNGIICLVMFISRVMVLKTSKIAYFFVFSANDGKNHSQFVQNI